MEFKLLYWYWLVFGMVLIIAELFIPSFTIFWFGLGAILVAGVLLMLPDLAISWQLFIWAIASCILTFLWFKFFKAISDDIADWGITIKTVEIQDINPSETMQKAMEEQAAAERGRRATVTRADGEKAAAILEAEGRLEASKRDAQAKVVLAEASQRAIQKVTDAIKDNELPVMFLLGEKYILTFGIMRQN